MKDAFTSILIFATVLFSTILVISVGFIFAKTADNVGSGEVKELGRITNLVEIKALGDYLDDKIVILEDVKLDSSLTNGQSSAKYVYGDTVKKALLKNETRIKVLVSGYDGNDISSIKFNYVYAVKLNGSYLNSVNSLENHKITEIEYEKIGIKVGSDE